MYEQIPISELERLCQKPDHRRVGNWMARRFARPVALRITRIVAPLGITANFATVVAWAFGLFAAIAFGWGSVFGWLVGAVLFQVWYLLDHVDGQLARLRGTASLDGVQLDYLMHHTVNLLVPVFIGFGLFLETLSTLWLACGLTFGLSLLLIGLQHDARYKAFIKRLKRVHGRLHVEGGGGGRPSPQPSIPRQPLRLAMWAARKSCETHVIMNTVFGLAFAQWMFGDHTLFAARVYLCIMVPVGICVAGWSIVRSQIQQSAEHEFSAWYRLPPGHEMVFLDCHWIIRPTGSSLTNPSQFRRPGKAG